METRQLSLASWMARNPLGILAAFISLIYAMSALLLGTAISKLTIVNQTVLVAFIAAFPILVLGCFVWLVAWHHKKLYAPQDYRSDESFHAADTTPEKIAERLREEIPSHASDGEKPATAQSSEEIAQATMQSLMGRTLIQETLIFMELQRKYQATTRRNISLNLSQGNTIEVDGVLETATALFVVEIIRARSELIFPRRLKLVLPGLALAKNAAKAEGKATMSVLCILRDELSREFIEKTVIGSDSPTPDNIELFELDELLNKYGLSAPNPHPSSTPQ